MSTIFYERLDGSTGWFESDIPPKSLERRPDGGMDLQDVLLEACVEGTGQRAWIRFIGGPFAIQKQPNRRHLYWQISADEAARWYSEASLSPPETLLEDLRAEQDATKSPPSSRKAPQTGTGE